MKTEKYKIRIRIGLFEEDIDVRVRYFFSKPSPELEFPGVHSIEFYGKATSNTGYQSNMIFANVLDDISIEDYLKNFVEDNSNSDEILFIKKII